MATDPFSLDHYTIRRQIFKLFGAGFHVYGPDGDEIAYSRQKAFRLKEDIRLFRDDTGGEELLIVSARQIVDFAAAYDVVDGRTREKVGAARRKGFRSILRDTWEVLDPDDRPLGVLEEDSGALAFIRRFLSNLVPQTFHLRTTDGKACATLKQHFNPFVYRLGVEIESDAIDRRLVFGLATLVAAIEGRQG